MVVIINLQVRLFIQGQIIISEEVEALLKFIRTQI